MMFDSIRWVTDASGQVWGCGVNMSSIDLIDSINVAIGQPAILLQLSIGNVSSAPA